VKIDELIANGLIKRTQADVNEIKGSLSSAKRFLDRAKGNIGIKFYDVAYLLAYTSMFHAARALLFKAGYKERGHYALIQALRETYTNNTELQRYLNLLDSYRISRHAIQYSGETCSELDATSIIEDAERFIVFIEKTLNQP
jgi:uncharacterized protein (UPF0332 family)